jgi:hypothetical protein
MSPGPDSTTPKIYVSRDELAVDVYLPADAEPELVNAEAIVMQIGEAGVVLDDPVRTAVRKLVESWEPGAEARGTVARGMAPVHGMDGRVEWSDAVLTGAEKAKKQDRPEGETQDAAGEGEACEEPVDFYSRSAFVMVEEGQPLGRVIPPQDGRDGIDVRGKSINAKPGRSVKLQHDDTVLINDDGKIIARTDGVLSRTRQKVAIRKFLEVPNPVDFSTGNIEFDGDIKLLKGVKDLFVVKATGNIEINGLIESATIEAGGDVFARGGMAGRERGSMIVGDDLAIRYLDACIVRVRGSLNLERELINCETKVGGAINAERGAIIGGSCECVGPIRVSMLGAAAHTRTDLTLGRVPQLEEKLAKLDSMLQQIKTSAAKAREELSLLSQPGRRLSTEQRERHTELSFEAHNAETRLSKCETARQEVLDQIRRLGVVDVRVSKMLYAGVVFHVGVQQVEIRKDVKGPLRVLRDRQGALVYRVGENGANAPLTSIGDVRAAAA